MKKKWIGFITVLVIIYLIDQEHILTTTAAVRQPTYDQQEINFFYDFSQWVEWRVIYLFDFIIRVVGGWF